MSLGMVRLQRHCLMVQFQCGTGFAKRAQRISLVKIRRLVTGFGRDHPIEIDNRFPRPAGQRGQKTKIVQNPDIVRRNFEHRLIASLRLGEPPGLMVRHRHGD